MFSLIRRCEVIGKLVDLLSGNNKSTKPIDHTIYPQKKEPVRDKRTGKIIIQNWELYKKDVDKYGGYYAQQCAEKGKYNKR